MYRGGPRDIITTKKKGKTPKRPEHFFYFKIKKNRDTAAK